MKTNLFILLLLASLRVAGQSVTTLPDQTIYPGNPYTLNLVVSRLDSAALASVTLYYDPNGRVVEQPNQPILSQSGRLLAISWSAAQTKLLPVNQRLWLEIKAGAVARQGAYVIVSRQPIKITAPGTFTVASPVVELSETGSTSKTYILNSISPTGYRITHNKGTRTVTAVFFRDDTGQVDPLWKIQISSDMYVDVVGPPGETFPGRVVLFFPIQTLSN